DLPMPGSPDISSTQPSSRLACSHRRVNRSISSSRPTSGVVVARSASNRLSVAPAPSTKHLPRRHILGETLERDGAEIAILEQATGQLPCARCNYDRGWVGQCLEPSGKVRRLADHRLLLGRPRSDQVANHNEASRNPDTNLYGGNRPWFRASAP